MNGERGILFMLHCPQHTGYAIASLERAFAATAAHLGYTADDVHFSYPQLTAPAPNCLQIDYRAAADREKLAAEIQRRNIETVLSFDLPFPSPLVNTARAAGVRRFVSYWGAGMSSINTGLKLALKRLECRLRESQLPDLFVFESEAMRRTATHGRGIPQTRTTVVPLGVDTETYTPLPRPGRAQQVCGVDAATKIALYSGHMEARKGVAVIIEAARKLASTQRQMRLHFLICGNRPGEEKVFQQQLVAHPAADWVTFGGYRDDMAQLMGSADFGIIPSTGWDSLTMSGIEMLSAGLPLLVSNLGGLPELVVDGHCGRIFPPGDHASLASILTELVEDEDKRQAMAEAARQRATSHFSQRLQIQRLAEALSPR